MKKSDEASEFLKVADQFHLGELSTEKSNPLSKGLSQTVNKNTLKAVASLKKIDVEMLELADNYLDHIFKLKTAIQETRQSGGRIFICGCGATGRLALSIETILRMEDGAQDIVSFMAGGDYALVRSIEHFEDNAQFAVQQLKELGFTKKDLLIGCSEGGETPFVIGAVEFALENSIVNPFFLYCNPDIELIKLDRCLSLFAKKNLHKLSLKTGPQALSGSTRMQASTLLMFAIGMAIKYSHLNYSDFKSKYKNVLVFLENIDYLPLKDFIEKESEVYETHGLITYTAPSDLAIAVLTDTTERTPTFSLKPFALSHELHHSLCYLTVDKTESSEEAWRKLLSRDRRGLEWIDISGNYSSRDMLSFDLSTQAIAKRESAGHHHHVFRVEHDNDEILFNFEEEIATWPCQGMSLLVRHLALKMLLNTHSTLVMGKLNRYTSNIMTFVRTSNNKLVDRATRYVMALLKEELVHVEYADIVKKIFSVKKDLNEDEPIVLKTVNALLEERGKTKRY
jgi:N-acetylmuramic acid 6-phosphate etherase